MKGKTMKKLSLFILVLALSLCCLFACGEDTESDNATIEREDYGTATVFAPGDTVQIISNSSAGNDLAHLVADELDPMLKYGKNGKAVIGSIYNPNMPLEIIIGLKDESRPETLTAYKHLGRIERESYFNARYLVYASSGRLVIAYDENEYTNIQVVKCIEELLLNLFKDREYVAIAEGIVLSGTVDLIAEQEELDRIQLDKEWSELEAVIGKEATDAFRVLYSMYGDDMVEWAANLYDPGTGGFYTCSSGRDGAEFGPDVEATAQLLSFFANSGMLGNLSNDWADFLPEKMQQQMIYFAKSLQNKNGYFYHPQWGKDVTDGKLSRRGRDLGWATSILSNLGSAPPYKAANGTKGDGVTADQYWQSLVDAGLDLGPKPYPSTESPNEADVATVNAILTSRLGKSTEDAVYDVILVSDVNPDDPEIDTSTEYLNSYTAYIDYLLVTMGPGFDENPYRQGNQMSATKSQIATKSAEFEASIGKYVYTDGDELTSTDAKTALSQIRANLDGDGSNDLTLADIYKQFSGMNMKEMTIFMLSEKINPEIGLWGKTSEKNPTGTEFLFTNGYFKTIGMYTSWGYAYPAEYIPQAANALMAGLLGDQPSTNNICEVYNIWSSIDALKKNLKYLDADDYALDENGSVIKNEKGEPILLMDKVADDVNRILNEKMAAALLNTHKKISGYKQPDGGFDHDYERTGGGFALQQGLPTGLRLNDQSNVDATCIASTGLTREIFSALGLSSYKIPIHTESDWMRALEIFLELDPVIKYSYDGNSTVSEYHDYEIDIPSTLYLSVTNNGIAENSFTQTVLGDRGVGFFNKTTEGKQLYLDWKINKTTSGAVSTVFETDIMFKDIKSAKSAIELRFYGGATSSATRLYSLYLYVDELEDGKTVYAAPKTQKTERVAIGKIGEWLNISLVYFEASGSGESDIPACFKLYVNGAETPVIVDPEFENEVQGGIAATNVGFARLITLAPFIGKIYFDNTKFTHEARPIVADEYTHNAGSTGGTGTDTPGTGTTPESSPALPSTGCSANDKDGILTFDSITAFPIAYSNGFTVRNASKAGWAGHISAEKEGDNSFIRINDLYSTTTPVIDEAQPIIKFELPENIERTNTLVVELEMRVSATADGSYYNAGTSYIDITLRSPVPTKPTDVQRVYQTYLGNNTLALNGDSKSGVANAVPFGEWFTFRLEYTVVGEAKESATFDVKAYVNGNLVQESTAVTLDEFGNSASVTQVDIITSKAFIAYLDIDDVSISYK